jgi:hypothetical protein
VELLVGALGVLLTAVGVGHQLWKARRRRKPDVGVKISYALLAFPDNAVGAVVLEALNHGDHLVRVVGVGFDAQDGSGNTVQLTQIPPGATIPGQIGAHDSGQTWVIADHDVGQVPFDLYRPLVGWVRLATDEKIKSEARTLMRR